MIHDLAGLARENPDYLEITAIMAHSPKGPIPDLPATPRDSIRLDDLELERQKELGRVRLYAPKGEEAPRRMPRHRFHTSTGSDPRRRARTAGRASIPLRVPRGPPPFLSANQNCNGSHDRTACADPAARRAPWPPAHGRCVNDLFLIRTEEGRRATENTESRMLLAESLTEQVIGLAIEVHRNTIPGLLEAIYEQCLCVEQRRAGVAFARQVDALQGCAGR